MKKNTTIAIKQPCSLFFIIPLLLFIVTAFVGCKLIDKVSDKINEHIDNSQVASDPYPDEVDHHLLNWRFGGFNGANAVLADSPRIGNIRMEPNRLYYNWMLDDLSAWGIGHASAEAICCIFVQDAAGNWVGGKFDWISSSRLFRDLDHLKGYNGWTLDGIPNPTRVAFVIVSRDGKQRTNIIVSDWSR